MPEKTAEQKAPGRKAAARQNEAAEQKAPGRKAAARQNKAARDRFGTVIPKGEYRAGPAPESVKPGRTIRELAAGRGRAA